MPAKRNKAVKRVVLAVLMYLSIIGYLSMFNIVKAELDEILILRNIAINLGVLLIVTLGIAAIITLVQARHHKYKPREHGGVSYKKNLRIASLCNLVLLMAMGYTLHIEFQPNNLNKLILITLPVLGIVIVGLTRPKEEPTK